MANWRFSGVDLSALPINLVSSGAFDPTKGDAATKLPGSIVRPFGWDNYDPTFVDDDIPF
jgi:hypothetical protein